MHKCCSGALRFVAPLISSLYENRMKNLQDKSLIPVSSRFGFASAAVALMCVLLSFNATADLWFDVNGTGPGYGINPNDNLSWDDMLWATAATAAPTTTWAANSTLSTPVFARFNSSTTPYTVTVN